MLGAQHFSRLSCRPRHQSRFGASSSAAFQFRWRSGATCRGRAFSDMGSGKPYLPHFSSGESTSTAGAFFIIPMPSLFVLLANPAQLRGSNGSPDFSSFFSWSLHQPASQMIIALISDALCSLFGQLASILAGRFQPSTSVPTVMQKQ